MDEYLLDNGHILFSYYNKKKNEGDSKHVSATRSNVDSTPSIMDFFQKHEEEHPSEEAADEEMSRY